MANKTVSIQNALNSGEISPSLFGRLDLEKWKNGSSTARNFFVDYRGGVKSRAGLAYVGTCKQEYPDNPPRDIPFQFNINQGYALEFGTEYMRVKSKGAYVTETMSPIINPNFGAIEGFVGASTPVGYSSSNQAVLEDRSIPYIVQLEGSPVATGSPGIKLLNYDDVGAEVLQKTVATLGIPSINANGGTCLHPNGNIYSTQGTSNSAVVSIVQTTNLSLLGTFGTAGSTVGSDLTHFADSFQMIPVLNNNHNYLVSVGLSSAAHNNEISLWDATGSTLVFQAIAAPSEVNAQVCEGDRNTGQFFALGRPNYGAGATTPFSLYKGSVSPSLTLTSIVSVSPTTIDPSWTNIEVVTGPGYDNSDGNVLCFVGTLDSVTNQNYLVKFNSSTGAVIWKTPVTVQVLDNCDLTKSYMDGLLQVHNHNTNSVINFDLVLHTQTSTAWNAGIGAAIEHQFFDHARGAIFSSGAYSQSTGPVPIYLGSYLASSGNTIPALTTMAIYSSQYLPGVLDDTSGIKITGITNSNPALFTINFGGLPVYSPGDWIYVRDVVGMTNFNGLTWIIDSSPSLNQYVLKDLFGNLVDSTNFPAYVSGGVTERLFTLETPYASEDLPYLKYTQSADTMTLTCVNPVTGTEYPPHTLIRHGNANWTLTQDVFSATITPPDDVTIVAYSSSTPTTWYSYVVTSVSLDTGEESVASSQVSVFNNDISLYLGSNTLSWTAVEGASSYNVYAAPASYSVTSPVSSVFGYIGTALGSSYVDSNITPDFVTVPPVHFDPFAIGAITDVVITAKGNGNYSQGTIGWSIQTSTGSGFDGFPIVANGNLVGFVILNQGQNYQPGDTITFTDSGGGLAKGSYTVTSQPSDNSEIFLNTSGTIFRVPGHAVDQPTFQMNIGATIPLTLQALASFLTSRAVSDINLGVATYTVDASHLYITYKTPGTVGNAYTLGTAPSGWTRSGTTLTGGGAVGTSAKATLTIGPMTGTYPSVPAYFQQRRVYAGSQNKPDTYWMSQPGLFSNMDTSIPVTDSDSITGTPWSQQVNGIQFLVPMPGGLVILTGKGAWQVNGGSSAGITPSNQTAIAQAYNGCNNIVPPIPINYDIVYIQAKGSILRDLSYNFYTNIYTGTDLTVLSNHLFQYNNINQMAWCEEPNKLVWCLRNDGILLCLTYMKEQDVYSWSRHDTNGLFVSICSVTEPPVDALYVITQRFIQGQWRYYSERMNDRLWQNVEGAFCVDSGVSYPVPNEVPGLAYLLTYPTQEYTSDGQVIIFPTATLNVSSSSGTGVTFTTSDTTEPPFTSNNIGDIIRVGGGKAVITSFVDDNNVIGDIINPITVTLQNNDVDRPVPYVSGSWSLAPVTSTVVNLNHLEGQTVSILADGSVVDSQVVTNGSVTLDDAASVITIGLPYTCQLQTLYLDHPDQTGTSQTRRKLITSVGLRVEASRGIQLGADQPDASTQPNYATVPWDDMNEIKERTNQTDAGDAVPLYTGDYFKTITSSWAVTGQVAVQQVYPLPANILAIVSYWSMGDDQ